MEPVHPEFVPDPALSREEMEALQDEIAAAATFEDDFDFDPDAVGLASAVDPGGDADQTHFVEGGGGDVARTDTPGDGGDLQGPIVAGVDQAFLDEQVVSAVVALRDGEVVERVHALEPLSIPYIPGLLSFREGGPILAAFEALAVEPDLVLFDGSGRIHFRQAGLATHLGVVLDVPAVGVAKSLLCGDPRGPTDALEAGERVAIEADARVDVAGGTLLGYAVQTRQFPSSRRINPVYVSPGHRVGPERAADFAFALAGDYKLPEPIRLADRYAGQVREALIGES